jgi:hypothetical protein
MLWRLVAAHSLNRDIAFLGGGDEMKRLGIVVGCLVLVGLVVVTPADALKAVALTCGQTITQSTRLANDLGPCPGDGLVIGADNITLDLGGHSITAANPAPMPDVTTGVRFGAHHDVTVRKGKILGYTPYRTFNFRRVDRKAVQVGGVPFDPGNTPADNGNHNRLQHLYTDANFSVDGDFNELSHNRAAPLVLGSHNKIANTETPPNYEQNATDDPRQFLCPSQDGLGIDVRGSFNEIEHNHACGLSVTWNTGPQDGSNNQIVGNTLTGPIQIIGGSPIPPGGPSPSPDPGTAISNELIRKNTITTTPMMGSIEDHFASIYLFDVTDSVVSKNKMNGDGIVLDQTPDQTPQQPIGPIDDNQIVGNTVSQARSDGFEVPGPQSFLGLAVSGARRTLVRGNVVRESGGDGINNGAPSSTLARNKADNNADLGIESVAGVVDGGGNRARGNGDPRECVNVVCR